jgi:glycosyltransferase involved in cell wall biosynthesis
VSKRICIVRQSYFPEEAHVRKNVDALADAGFHVDVMCLRAPGEAARESYRGGTVCRLPLTHRRGGKTRYLLEYAAFFAMAALLLTMRSLRRRYDIVEVYNIPDALVFAALPAKLLGAKVVFYMFELMPEQAADEWRLPADHALVRRLRWLERRAVRFADRVIVVSPYDKEIVARRDAPQRELTVILNVPEERLFNARRSVQPVARNGVFRIITHGSLLRRYGIQTLVRALPRMMQEIPRVELCILGDGEYRGALEQLARELDVDACVRFPGWIAHEDVPAEIARADVGVVPASVPWLLPNKLFEYVAMGKPVVAAASPSLSAVFPNDALAYFWPDDERDLARRVIELYADQSKARLLASNALRAYEAYRWETIREVYVALHEELLTGTQRLRTGEEAA